MASEDLSTANYSDMDRSRRHPPPLYEALLVAESEEVHVEHPSTCVTLAPEVVVEVEHFDELVKVAEEVLCAVGGFWEIW